MRILSLSDVVDPFLYSPALIRRCGNIDLLISCGDVPLDYLEYVSSMLGVPLYFVHGNHVREKDVDEGKDQNKFAVGTNLHLRVVRHHSGVLLAGVEGSLRYRQGQHQYSQSEMWMNVLSLVPALIRNRILYGRYLDIFVTHAPEWRIHDEDDLPHRGIKAFNWLIRTFQPAFHLHGHIHVYRPDVITETKVGKTRVINTYGYKLLELDIKPTQK